jgi:hypothetical protein
LLAIAGAALTLGACAGPSTTLDQSWAAPVDRSGPHLQRVVTLFVGESVTMRHHAEDELARDLRARGLDATSSYAIIGDEPIADIEVAKPKLLALGYDGLVTMRIVDRENTIKSVPGASYYGYYGYSYGWSTDYLYPQTIYRIETVAYSLRTGKLVWSGTTKSVDPDTLDELIEDTTDVVAGQLVRRRSQG